MTDPASPRQRRLSISRHQRITLYYGLAFSSGVIGRCLWVAPDATTARWFGAAAFGLMTAIIGAWVFGAKWPSNDDHHDGDGK